MPEFDAPEIGTLLGLREERDAPLSAFSLTRRIEDGLPIRSLHAVVEHVAPDDKSFISRVVPKATLARRAKSRRLKPDESDKVARLARIWRAAIDVWQDDAAARAFLRRPHPLLEGRAPLDLVLGNEVGAKLVEDILGRLKYGSAA